MFGKLSNQRTLLLRHNRTRSATEIADAAAEIDFYRHQSIEAEHLSQLLGIEGIASRSYWNAFGKLLPETFAWKGRQRRPPPNLANAALGYGYAILTGETATALAIAGLDAAAGFLHTDHERRPSLALDLMEEFLGCPSFRCQLLLESVGV